MPKPKKDVAVFHGSPTFIRVGQGCASVGDNQSTPDRTRSVERYPAIVAPIITSEPLRSRETPNVLKGSGRLSPVRDPFQSIAALPAYRRCGFGDRFSPLGNLLFRDNQDRLPPYPELFTLVRPAQASHEASVLAHLDNFGFYLAVGR